MSTVVTEPTSIYATSSWLEAKADEVRKQLSVAPERKLGPAGRVLRDAIGGSTASRQRRTSQGPKKSPKPGKNQPPLMMPVPR